MSDNFIADMEEISREVAQHQIETFGRVLTREESAQSEIERHEESMKKYENMTPAEAARVRENEYESWEKEMRNTFGPELFEGFNYLEDVGEDYNSAEERNVVNV